MYETKVLLTALAEIIVKSDSKKEIYRAVQKMANVEGVVLKPYDEAKEEIEIEKENKGDK